MSDHLPAAPLPIAASRQAPNTATYFYADGRAITLHGDRPYRNNNPGNLRFMGKSGSARAQCEHTAPPQSHAPQPAIRFPAASAAPHVRTACLHPRPRRPAPPSAPRLPTCGTPAMPPAAGPDGTAASARKSPRGHPSCGRARCRANNGRGPVVGHARLAGLQPDLEARSLHDTSASLLNLYSAGSAKVPTSAAPHRQLPTCPVHCPAANTVSATFVVETRQKTPSIRHCRSNLQLPSAPIRPHALTIHPTRQPRR